MSQQSEERLPESTTTGADTAPGARILHMKSTPYDLQKAIQQRAQESVEREAELDREERRPKPLKWLVISAIACVPIVLTLVAVDGFLRAFHRYLNVTTSQQALPGDAAPAPEATTSQPGVVLLQPMNVPDQAPAQAAPESSTSGSTAAPRN